MFMCYYFYPIAIRNITSINIPISIRITIKYNIYIIITISFHILCPRPIIKIISLSFKDCAFIIVIVIVTLSIL